MIDSIAIRKLIQWGTEQITKCGAALASAQNYTTNKSQKFPDKKITEYLDIIATNQEPNKYQLDLQQKTLELQNKHLESQMKRDYLHILTNWIEKEGDITGAIQQANQEFTTIINQMELQKNAEINQFIDSIQSAINQNNIEWNMLKAEQETELALQIKKTEGEFIWVLREFDRQTQLEYLEARLNSEKEIANFPILNSARQILNNATDSTLRIVYAPVTVKYSPSETSEDMNRCFPADLLQLKVETKLSQLANFYLNNGRAVKFLGRAWDNALFRAESASLSLFDSFKSIPFLILDAEVTDNIFYLRHSFWGINWSDFRSYPLMPNLSWNEVQIAFAQQSALQWKYEREEAENKGENPGEIDEFYGHEQVEMFVKHLDIMEREKKALERGKSLDRGHRPYQITKYDMEESTDFLAIWHCIYAGLFADEYFLLHGPFEKPLPPILPQLLPSLLQSLAVPHQQMIVQSLLNYYEIFYQILKMQGHEVLVPELRLQAIVPWFSSSVSLHKDRINPLPNKLLNNIKNQVILSIRDSIREWLELRGITKVKDESLLSALEEVLVFNSQYGEGYFYRGLCYLALKQFEISKREFSQSLKLKVREGESYFYRGKCEYELGSYNRAINDFEQAICLGVNEAISHRELIYQVVADLQRKYEEEEQWKREEAKRKAEAIRRKQDNQSNKISSEVKTVATQTEKTFLQQKTVLQRRPEVDYDEISQLKSEKGINYRTLQEYLKEGNWQKADEETSRLMLQIMHKSSWNNVYGNDLQNFPATDLRTLDYLWLKYSDAKFGFSVQKNIWVSSEVGGKLEQYEWETYCKFGEKVGWKKGNTWLNYAELTFNQNAGLGHLPALLCRCTRVFRGVPYMSNGGQLFFSFLAQKL